jgi:hypothetical protein
MLELHRLPVMRLEQCWNTMERQCLRKNCLLARAAATPTIMAAPGLPVRMLHAAFESCKTVTDHHDGTLVRKNLVGIQTIACGITKRDTGMHKCVTAE